MPDFQGDLRLMGKRCLNHDVWDYGITMMNAINQGNQEIGKIRVQTIFCRRVAKTTGVFLNEKTGSFRKKASI